MKETTDEDYYQRPSRGSTRGYERGRGSRGDRGYRGDRGRGSYRGRGASRGGYYKTNYELTREAEFDDVEEVHLDKDQIAVLDSVKAYCRENFKKL